jgi:hypothetical protein
MTLDVVPMLLTFVCPAEGVPKGGVEKRYLAAGLATSAVVVLAVRPPIGFVVGAILSLYFWASVRDWCEHFGDREDGFANTYWFPLGMGIGNHAAHHRHPGLSWIAMALGLRKRTKDSSVLRAAYRMAKDRRFRHYGP